MSISFNDTTNLKGLVQLYEREIGVNQGDISGNASLLREFTADVNIALDNFFSIAIKSSGTWQIDDSNQTDYPIMTTNIVSGQRDYSFTVDGSGNLILDFYKVLVADSTGYFREISPVDQQTPKNNRIDPSSFLDGKNQSGVPARYDKTGNGIFLDAIPNYNFTGGLKILVNREASYFASSDTTKKPGIPGLFHNYFFLKPAQDYARRKTWPRSKRVDLDSNVMSLENEIAIYFMNREKDSKKRMLPNVECNK